MTEGRDQAGPGRIFRTALGSIGLGAVICVFQCRRRDERCTGAAAPDEELIDRIRSSDRQQGL